MSSTIKQQPRLLKNSYLYAYKDPGRKPTKGVSQLNKTYSVLLAPLVGLVYIHVELVYCSFNKEKRSIVWLYSSPLNYQACPKANTLLFLKAF